ncbi:hypothetical protein J1D01_12465, partial [Seonamhaeicola sp. NFXS20]
MKKLYTIIKALMSSKYNFRFLLFSMLLISAVYNSYGQVKVPFAPRTSAATPSQTIYNVKGDFTMIGNTNLTLVSYGDNTNNSLDMEYVDVDETAVPGNNTFNSSSATLTFSNENGAIPECSEIIYAGIYWTGRTDSYSGDGYTFDVSKEIPTGGSTTQQFTDTNEEIFDNNNIPNTNYTLTISSSGGGGGGPGSTNTTRYLFTSSGAGDSVEFIYRTSGGGPGGGTQTLHVSVNGGAETTVSTSSINNSNAYLSSPYEIFSDSNYTLEVNRLRRQDDDRAYVNITYFEDVPNTTTITKNFDKRKVLIKGPASSTYTDLTANEIYFPNGEDGNMYSAYAEVTDYVQTNGLGEYFVADIATLEGDGGNTGYYGGWGMVVVYENSKMDWRDVTVFDGHAYVQGSVTENYTFDISGFQAAQNGPVNVKLGVMAGEGDVGVSGDYLEILRQDNGTYQALSHSNNSTNNFFNSSIVTGGNARTPDLPNNTGVDIAMFDIDNTGNGIIDNNQTSTTFRYGSTQDTYIIYNLTLSVDAYVPEPEGIISNTTINGNPPGPTNNSLEPNEEADYIIEIKNTGTEAIDNAVLTLPLPASVNPSGLNIVSNTFFTPQPSGPTYDASIGTNGAIVWDLGTLPLPSDPNTVLANISFTLTVTTDCSILSDPMLGQTVSLEGTLSGVGAISGVSFSTSLIQGYEATGVCTGDPIPVPHVIDIDYEDFVNEAPVITAPSPININGCDENDITASTVRYPYSATQSADIKDTYVDTGYTASDNGTIVSITYIDEIDSNDCPIVVTRTYTATDDCGNTTEAIQIINLTPSDLVISDVQDSTVNACDFANQADLDAAFNSWIAGFSVSGGCNPQATDISSLTAPDLCDGGAVSVEFNVTDLCESGQDTATFTVT